jgi:hypothetical protein
VPSREPNFYITEANYYQLTGPGFWKLNDVSPMRWEQCGGHFSHPETYALLASGSLPQPLVMHGIPVVGGVDWIRLESNRSPGEPDINAYHYVIGMPDHHGYPVYGPYRNGCRIEHHPSGNNIEPYTTT